MLVAQTTTRGQSAQTTISCKCSRVFHNFQTARKQTQHNIYMYMYTQEDLSWK